MKKIYLCPVCHVSVIKHTEMLCSSPEIVTDGKADSNYDQLSKGRSVSDENVHNGWVDGLW